MSRKSIPGGRKPLSRLLAGEGLLSGLGHNDEQEPLARSQSLGPAVDPPGLGIHYAEDDASHPAPPIHHRIIWTGLIRALIKL